MNHSEQDPTPTSSPIDAASSVSSGLASIARRRGLLRGLSAGAALSGAALPMSALATGPRKSCFHKDTPSRKCKASVSTMGSAITSNQINDWPESKGKHCSYYQNTANWPKNGSGQASCKGWNGAYFTSDKLYKSVFNCGGGGYNDWKIKDLMTVNCPQRTWLTACLNATSLGAEFSYTPQEIAALHSDPGRTLDAQTFFRDYQENYYS